MLDLEQTPELPPEPEKASSKSNVTAASGWDETHRSIFATMQDAGYCVILTEHEGKPMAKLHTFGLLVDRNKNKRLGRYSTVSKGTKPQEPNAYAFPLPDGGLLVFRYHDVAETEDWQRSQSGKTYICYNVKTTIYIRAAIDQTVDESIDALRDAPGIHQRGGVLVEVTHEADKPKQCLADDGGARYRVITPPALMVQLSRLATYQKFDERKRQWVDRVPPENVVNGVLAAARFPGIPVATGVVSCPVLRADGTVAHEPGYDGETGLYLDLDGGYPPLMPVEEARELLCDVFCDFPFATLAHRSGAIANIVTLVARHAFPGPAPCFVYDAPRPRVGKGLATDTVTMVAHGRRASRYDFPNGKDEMRKFITSVALSGVPYVLFDNVKVKFGGATLENALTANRWSDRILGVNKHVEIPLNLVWMATINNAVVTADMVGRCVHIRFETDCERPDTRTGFKYPDLLGYVMENRRRLVMAAVSIPAHFLKANPTVSLSGWGGFEGWSKLVRASLVWSGLPDPDTRETLAQAEDDTALLRQLMDAWEELGGPATVAEAIKAVDADKAPKLKAVLAGLSYNRNEELGKVLRDYRGWVVGGRKFDRTNASVPKWLLLTVASAGLAS